MPGGADAGPLAIGAGLLGGTGTVAEPPAPRGAGRAPDDPGGTAPAVVSGGWGPSAGAVGFDSAIAGDGREDTGGRSIGGALATADPGLAGGTAGGSVGRSAGTRLGRVVVGRGGNGGAGAGTSRDASAISREGLGSVDFDCGVGVSLGGASRASRTGGAGLAASGKVSLAMRVPSSGPPSESDGADGSGAATGGALTGGIASGRSLAVFWPSSEGWGGVAGQSRGALELGTPEASRPGARVTRPGGALTDQMIVTRATLAGAAATRPRRTRRARRLAHSTHGIVSDTAGARQRPP